MFTHKEILELEERARKAEAENYKLSTILKAIRSSIDLYLRPEYDFANKVKFRNFEPKNEDMKNEG